MKIKIGEELFDLAPQTLEAVLNLTEQATKGVEQGFQMCQQSDGAVVPGKKCVGGACSIHLKDCSGIGPRIGEFHTHPTVISFSLGDYLSAIQAAAKSPDHHYLTCVSLLDKGIRCKALTKMPTAAQLKGVGGVDTEENRAKVKPFFTPRVNISLKQLAALLVGMPWEELPPSEVVMAVDETEADVCPGEGKVEACPTAMAEEEGGAPVTPGALPWPTVPTGQYPWSQKKQFKSVKTAMGVTMEPIPQATILSPETEFIDITTIEEADPDLIAMGEVMSYVNALVPVQLLKQKDAEGKWIVHDGRHRLVAWKMAGYKQIPVVFVEPSVETEAAPQQEPESEKESE